MQAEEKEVISQKKGGRKTMATKKSTKPTKSTKTSKATTKR